MYIFMTSHCFPSTQAKKAREQAALKNAQSLFEELDAEREKKERREKAAAKKRNKRKEKKRKEQAEKMVSFSFLTVYIIHPCMSILTSVLSLSLSTAGW